MNSIDVKDIVKTLDDWHRAGPPAGPTRGKPPRPLRDTHGAKITKHVESLLAAPVDGHTLTRLAELAKFLPEVNLHTQGRAVTTKSERQPLLARVRTLQRDFDPALQHEVAKYGLMFPGEGGPQESPFEKLSSTPWLRAQVAKTTMKSEAYVDALSRHPHYRAEKSLTLAGLSTLNLKRFEDALGPVTPQEQRLFDRLTRGSMFFKHATDAYGSIRASGRMISPNAGIDRSGTSVKNNGFNHVAYVFGRLELAPGPMKSRFGGTTLEVPFEHLPPDICISLRDQSMPFVSSPTEISHAGNMLRKIAGEVSSSEWRQEYPASAQSHPVSFLDEIFTGRSTCRKGLALYVLLELRRMAALDKPTAAPGCDTRHSPVAHSGSAAAGAQLRQLLLDDKATDADLTHWLKQLVRVEIRVPRFLALPTSLQVYNAAGAGEYSATGEFNVAMKNANEVWRGQKKLLDGDSPSHSKIFLDQLKAAIDPHIHDVHTFLTTKKIKRGQAEAAQGSFEVLCTWEARLQELARSLKKRPGTPNETHAGDARRIKHLNRTMELLQASISKATAQFAAVTQQKGSAIEAHAGSYVSRHVNETT